MAKEENTPPEQERSIEEALAESNASNAIASLEKNKMGILLIAVLATVIVCGVLIFNQLKAGKHSDASQAFSAAVAAGDTDALDKVVADFPGSLAAGNSMLSKAEIQLNRGKPQDAKSTLQTFVSDFGTHPRVAQGIFAIGNIEHIAGDLDAAKASYEKALEKQESGDLSPLIRIRLGDIALESGDAEKAELLYLESVSKHPGNPFVERAEQKIELAKIGNPPVVPRPAPPEPEPDPVPETEAPVIKDGDPAPEIPAPKPVEPETPAAPAPAEPETPAAPAPAEPETPAPAPAEPETPAAEQPE